MMCLSITVPISPLICFILFYPPSSMLAPIRQQVLEEGIQCCLIEIMNLSRGIYKKPKKKKKKKKKTLMIPRPEKDQVCNTSAVRAVR